MIDFDDPKWRSPLTGSTKAVILEKRRMHRVNCARVNVQIRAIYAERERIALELKEREDERDGQAD